MRTTIPVEDMLGYIGRQCDLVFPDGNNTFSDVKAVLALDDALQRCDECFKHITLRGYRDGRGGSLSHLHSDQWTQFLYFFASSLYRQGCEDEARKVSNLGRILSSCFISYKCELPEHFLLGHPMGSVIGNADYGDCLVVFQNVTINTGADGTGILLPHIGRGLFMSAGSALIGVKSVGNRCSIGVNTVVYDKEIPDDSVCTIEGKIRPRRRQKCKASEFFDLDTI